jgi:hypothetical protein
MLKFCYINIIITIVVIITFIIFIPYLGASGITLSTAPQARGGHTATVVDGYMYVLGGNDVVDTFEDLWKIPLQDVINYVKIASGETNTLELNDDDRKEREFRSPKWECLHRHCYAKGGPSAVIGHSVNAVGRTLVVYGGRNKISQAYGHGVHLYDIDSNKWLDITPCINLPRDYQKLKRELHRGLKMER